jgi:glucokinase
VKNMFLGIDIGGTKCAVTLGDENGLVLRKERFLTTTVDETIENIIRYAKSNRAKSTEFDIDNLI